MFSAEYRLPSEEDMLNIIGNAYRQERHLKQWIPYKLFLFATRIVKRINLVNWGITVNVLCSASLLPRSLFSNLCVKYWHKSLLWFLNKDTYLVQSFKYILGHGASFIYRNDILSFPNPWSLFNAYLITSIYASCFPVVFYL